MSLFPQTQHVTKVYFPFFSFSFFRAGKRVQHVSVRNHAKSIMTGRKRLPVEKEERRGEGGPLRRRGKRNNTSGKI